MVILTSLSVQLFLSLMSAATTEIAPVLSITSVFYTILSLYSFSGLPCSKFVDLSTSYFASFKLSAFLLGYLFDAMLVGKVEVCYTLLTIMVTAEAYYGMH